MSRYNVTSGSVSHWRAALTRQAGGGRPATILCAGDSNTQDDTGLLMWHEGTRALLQSDQPSTWDEGFSFFTFPQTGLDPRRNYGTDWYINNGGDGPAIDGTLSVHAGAISTFAYGPVTCDSFRLHFRRSASTSFTYSVDSGAVSSPVDMTTGSGTYAYIDIPAGSAGAHTLKLQSLSGYGVNAPNFLAVEWTTSSAARRRRIAACGRFGAQTNIWASNLPAIYSTLNPDLTIALIGSNDFGNGVSTATTLTNLGTWIDAAHAAGGDFCLVVPAPASYTPVPPAPTVQPPADLVTGLYSLADSKNVPLIDLKARWIDFNTAKFTNGFISDYVHFTNAGHADLSHEFEAAVLAISNETAAPDPGTPPPVLNPSAKNVYRLVGGVLTPVNVYGADGLGRSFAH